MPVVSRKIALVLIVMATGRAMTIPFIHRAGDGGVGDPPDAWLMPLIGDAAIGLAAIAVAMLVLRSPSPSTWVFAISWSAIGAFDAVAAFLIEATTPWPEFFMLELVGRPMFVGAVVLHVAIIALLMRPDALADFGIEGLTTSRRDMPSLPPS